VLKQSAEISASQQQFRDFVHRIRRSDGAVRWIRVSGVPRFDPDGKFMDYRGITLDITQQWEHENELLLRTEAAEAPLVAGTSSKACRFPFPGPKALIVDDNSINRRLTQRIFEQFGARVETADGGRECLEIFAGRSFDIILVDVQLPGMDGHEATRLIRILENEAGRPRAPIVALTAGAMRGDRDRCLEAGMDEYLTKPIRREALTAILCKMLPAHVDRVPSE
jgi:CheY-like chemotaxis protein